MSPSEIKKLLKNLLELKIIEFKTFLELDHLLAFLKNKKRAVQIASFLKSMLVGLEDVLKIILNHIEKGQKPKYTIDTLFSYHFP